MDILVTNKRWDDLVKLITPLDLVLFAGKDVVSSTIKTLQDKKLNTGTFSHLGIIVSSFILPHIKELDSNEWYVWESTSSLRLPGFENEVPDVFGNHKLGVQIRNLKSVLDIYNGEIYIGKLKNNPLYNNYQLDIDSTHAPEVQKIEHAKTIPRVPKKIETTDNMLLSEFSTEKAIQNEFDNVIEEINREINSVDKILYDSIDTSNNYLIRKMKDTMREINKNIDEAMEITKQIDKEIEDLCIYMNKIVYHKYITTKQYKYIVKEIKNIYEIYGSRIYNASFLDLLSALYPILRPFRNLKYKILKNLGKLFKNKKIGENAVFCSQFVAIVYAQLGIIDRSIDVKNFVPVDFLGCDEDGQKNVISNLFKIVK